MVKLPPEKLGSFYLGAAYDLESKTIKDSSINYDSRDLTTHAVCVGMTGSGKTGLCIDLLEEAAIDKVPAIIIDPKGDMTNLLLQFGDLAPKDFEPWIDANEAGRKGKTVEEQAEATAAMWEAGLAEWGQTKSRVWKVNESVDYTIYTPGSTSGVPVNILGSFAVPKMDFEENKEVIHERIQGIVAALLGIVDYKVDPVKSREAIVLFKIIEESWKKKNDVDLAAIIHGIQEPPVMTAGLMSMESFFPKKERFEMAMTFNNLVAAPQFQNWLEGDALDIEKMFFTPMGQPRHSIFYIAHLSESERMFFVTLLLNSFVSWMRQQSGTSSLRSLLYFDEIFGYFPPTSEPPSKKPLLTILKQGRAYGVGAVLVTQNPVDIDYKGLSNAGTWFIGKLQTERDKDRVLEGLKGAIAEAGTSEEQDFDQIISSLSSRVFLMHNVHDTKPVVFHTRWAMSYLCGPMTRPQIKTLMEEKRNSGEAFDSRNVIQAQVKMEAARSTPRKAVPFLDEKPVVSNAVDQRFFDVRITEEMAKKELNDETLFVLYEPCVLAAGTVRFYNNKLGVDVTKDISALAELPDGLERIDWANAKVIENWGRMVTLRPRLPYHLKVKYSTPPETMTNTKEVAAIRKDFSDWVYRTQEELTLEHKALTRFKNPGESEAAFRMRVEQEAREERDEELDALQDQYEAKFERLSDRIRKEEQDLEEALADLQDRKSAEWLGVAETIFSVFVQKRSRSVSSIASKSRMRRKATQKAEAAREDLEDLREDYERLELELRDKLNDIREKWDKIATGITVKAIKPRRTDIRVHSVVLAWHPYWVNTAGKRISGL